MSGSIVNNYHTEKIAFLPDETELLVSRQWCCYVIVHLSILEEYGDLVYMIRSLVAPKTRHGSDMTYVPRVVPLSVGIIKKLVAICGDETLCCTFPYNYDEIADKFLENKLGEIKTKIESLMAEDKIEETFQLIETIKDEYLRKLALLYTKNIHNRKTETIIENIKKSRKRTINEINKVLY